MALKKSSTNNVGDKRKKIRYQVKNREWKIYDRYQPPIKLIGSGAYSAVISITDSQTGKQCAIKKVLGLFDHISDARRTIIEIKLLLHLHHINILPICDLIGCQENEIDAYNEIYIVQPKMDTTLAKVIRSKQPLTDRHFQYIMYQILRGLAYIHSANIIYADLKPENILINGADCKLKISGFDKSSIVELYMGNSYGTSEYITTRWYKGPGQICGKVNDMELIQKELLVFGYFRQFEISLKINNVPNDIKGLIAEHFVTFIDDTKADIWSVGCILAELIMRKPLFPGQNYLDQLKVIFNVMGKPKDVSWIGTHEAKKWINKLDDDNFKGKGIRYVLDKCSAHKGNKPIVTEGVVQLLENMLKLNPWERYSAVQCLRDPYFKDLYRVKDEKLCKPFEISMKMDKLLKTKFGCRHVLYDLTEEFFKSNKRVRDKIIQ